VGVAAAGALSAADSSRRAANTQRDAANQANELSQQQAAQIRSDLTPYRDLGTGSTNLMARYLGLQDEYTGPRQSLSEIRNMLMEQQGPTGQLGSGGARMWNGGTEEGGRVIQWMNGVPYSVSTETNGDGSTREVYSQIQDYKATPYDPSALDARAQELYGQQQADYAAWQAEQAKLAQDPSFGSLLRNFTGQDLQNEPGYQFGLQQGQQALDRRLASGGNYFSGAALKGATRFAQDYAGTKYQDAFNRDSANKTRTYNFLSGMTSLGENAAAQTGNAGQNMANQVGANTMGAANAAGAAQIASSNAFSNGMNNAVSGYQQNQLLNAVMAGNRGWGSTSNNLANGPSNNAGMYGLDSSFNQYLAQP
jgi:hypothetical protein